jgi:hypothetical protein
MRDAEKWLREESMPYPVLVDDLSGTVHQSYGGLADPTYLLDSAGRVAFYNMWTHAPMLHQAIEEVLGNEQRGHPTIVGVHRIPHLAATITDGWRGLRRGLPQSAIELELTLPTSATGIWLGYQLRPLLAPITLRAKPLPAPVKTALAIGAAAGAVLFARRVIDRGSFGQASQDRSSKPFY